jgi:hypothetical protein
MPKNMFSPLIGEEVGHFRRIGHSAQNWLSSSFYKGLSGEETSGFSEFVKEHRGAIPENVVVPLAAVGGIGIALGVVGAVAGPQAAVGVGVVAAVVAGVGAAYGVGQAVYSNRDAAHKELSKYVWNLVDDNVPEFSILDKENLYRASGAAMYLMQEAKNQIILLQPKLPEVNKNLVDFDKVVNKKIGKLTVDFMLLMNVPARDVSKRTDAYRQYVASFADFHDEFAKAMTVNGAIFEAVRRYSHIGNYIQAPLIISRAMERAMEETAGRHTAPLDQDPLSGFSWARESRTTFTNLDKKYWDQFKDYWRIHGTVGSNLNTPFIFSRWISPGLHPNEGAVCRRLFSKPARQSR